MLKNNFFSNVLPEGEKTYLDIPNPENTEEFIFSAKKSIDLHHPWVKPPLSKKEYDSYLQKINFDSHFSFLIRAKSSKSLVGVANISEIVKGVFQSGYLGYYAFQGFHGQGFMKEGLALVLEVYFKTLQLHRLEANIQPENIKSISLIKKLHFRREGFSPKYLKINDRWCDHERYAMTLEDYISNQSSFL